MMNYLFKKNYFATEKFSLSRNCAKFCQNFFKKKEKRKEKKAHAAAPAPLSILLVDRIVGCFWTTKLSFPFLLRKQSPWFCFPCLLASEREREREKEKRDRLVWFPSSRWLHGFPHVVVLRCRSASRDTSTGGQCGAGFCVETCHSCIAQTPPQFSQQVDRRRAVASAYVLRAMCVLFPTLLISILLFLEL